jgi:hypothetical protein
MHVHLDIRTALQAAFGLLVLSCVIALFRVLFLFDVWNVGAATVGAVLTVAGFLFFIYTG